MKLPVADLIVFIIITLGNVIFGASFFLRNKTSDQFTSGGGKLPAWVVGMSIFATFVSSISFLALPGKAYMFLVLPYLLQQFLLQSFSFPCTEE